MSHEPNEPFETVRLPVEVDAQSGLNEFGETIIGPGRPS